MTPMLRASVKLWTISQEALHCLISLRPRPGWGTNSCAHEKLITLRQERTAWAYALNKLRPFIKVSSRKLNQSYLLYCEKLKYDINRIIPEGKK